MSIDYTYTLEGSAYLATHMAPQIVISNTRTHHFLYDKHALYVQTLFLRYKFRADLVNIYCNLYKKPRRYNKDTEYLFSLRLRVLKSRLGNICLHAVIKLIIFLQCYLEQTLLLLRYNILPSAALLPIVNLPMNENVYTLTS